RHGARYPSAGAASRRADCAGQPHGGGARASGDLILSRRGGDLMLSVENIDVFYGDAQALDGVSLEVEEGAIVAIVGANGAGETSLIRTIAGMLRPARGVIRYRGSNIAGCRVFACAI